MKRLIIPIVIALLAGIGGGSGYAYMHTSPIAAADSAAHDSTAKDGTTHARPSSADSAKQATDSAIVDSMHAADSLHASDTTHAAAAVPLTPADSIRALQTARATIKSEVKAGPKRSATASAHAATATSATETAKPATTKPAATIPAATIPAAAKADAKTVASTQQVAEAVRSARNDALNTALPEQRLAKIFGAMQAKDAAKVLEQMTDSDIRAILGLMSDRQAAAIISTLPALRAATITRGAVRAPGGTTP